MRCATYGFKEFVIALGYKGKYIRMCGRYILSCRHSLPEDSGHDMASRFTKVDSRRYSRGVPSFSNLGLPEVVWVN